MSKHQGAIVLKDFDISNEAGGVDRAITKNFIATVSENHLEIHLLWAGKGICCIPQETSHGPSISKSGQNHDADIAIEFVMNKESGEYSFSYNFFYLLSLLDLNIGDNV
ncbi:hypothetical protein SLEP1_g54140 [Rubroshorea leprosula]|uniref:Malectin domain-containing protein n=1 Tax=Rubroshorea leprosula TaxID=152421 RepID=A0AAV5MEE0_9ROSI|nr:hypothetical protein SLEP1_g54140 [Rubroshorea leprosula]